MIIILNKETLVVTTYRTLIKACKAENWMSYSYLKRIKLSNIAHEYKGHNLFRIKHS